MGKQKNRRWWCRQPLRFENLDARNLLAADFSQIASPTSEPNEINPTAFGAVRAADIGVSYEEWASTKPFRTLFYTPDQIFEFAEFLVVADGTPESASPVLTVFERHADGGLENLREIALDFQIDRLTAYQERLVVLGTRYDEEMNYITVVVTVDVGRGDGDTRQEFAFGTSSISHDGSDRVAISLFESTADPVTPIARKVAVYQISDEGLRETHAMQIPNSSELTLHGDELLVSTFTRRGIDSELLDEPRGSLIRLALRESGDLVQLSDVGLHGAMISNLGVSDDGQSGYAVRKLFNGAFGSKTFVDLLDLTEGSLRIYQTVELPNFYDLVGVGDDSLFLSSANDRLVATVDLTPSTDLTAAARTHVTSINVGHGPIHVFLIDAENRRLVIVSDASTAVIGRLEADGQFRAQDSIPMGQWLEVDANPERLVVREPSRVLLYHWDDLQNPLISPIIGKPKIQAIDDTFELQDDDFDYLLDLLANDRDRRQHPYSEPLRIVRLIGAPEGARVEGNQVWIPAAALQNADTFAFQYVMSDGLDLVMARVNVDVDRSYSFDTNGDGTITAADALAVINFISCHGEMDIEQSPEVQSKSARSHCIDTTVSQDLFVRLDTNGDGRVSALDALVIINRLDHKDSRQSPPRFHPPEFFPPDDDHLVHSVVFAQDFLTKSELF